MIKQIFFRFLKNIRHTTRSHLAYIGVDLVLIGSSLYLSLLLRVGAEGLSEYGAIFTELVLTLAVVKMACLVFCRVYSSLWRYFSAFDVYKIINAMILSGILSITFSYMFLAWRGIPRSFFFIDFVLCLAFLLGGRFFRRALFESKIIKRHTQGPEKKKTLIYGAGLTGLVLLQRLQQDILSNLEVIGFIDDNLLKVGKNIGGVKVLGAGQDITKILENTKISQIIIASSTLKGDVFNRFLQTASSFGIRPKIVTDFSSNLANENFNFLRKVNLGDLLNRKISNLKTDDLAKAIKSKTVLVTGAGGSIGSEIARQLVSLSPSKLIICDHSEYNLYKIDRELQPVQKDESISIIPILADIRDRRTLLQIFKGHRPFAVFHAAAYKHVHLAEANPLATILNNIEGSKNSLELASEFGAKYFINISTDKAVNPQGIMGATKRACELLTSYFGHSTGHSYCSVRFGNVLGSSGSIIPLLKEQIESGGPVTITHAEMERYFMLISEAVRLVIFSAVISKPGDINVLDMGKPIKIVDLAKNLMILMGYKEGEIPIVFTSPRPGEKMSEELYLRGDEIKTVHPDILTLPKSGDINFEEVSAKMFLERIQMVIEYAKSGESKAVEELYDIVSSSPLMTSEPLGQNALPSKTAKSCPPV